MSARTTYSLLKHISTILEGFLLAIFRYHQVYQLNWITNLSISFSDFHANDLNCCKCALCIVSENWLWQTFAWKMHTINQLINRFSYLELVISPNYGNYLDKICEKWRYTYIQTEFPWLIGNVFFAYWRCVYTLCELKCTLCLISFYGYLTFINGFLLITIFYLRIFPGWKRMGVQTVMKVIQK